MNHDMLQNIEYLRERAAVTYEEAMELLQNNSHDVTGVLIELEKQGRLYAQSDDCGAARALRECRESRKEAKGKAKTFFNKAKQTRVVVEKETGSGDKATIANISALAAAGVTILAPHFAFVAVLLTLITGHQLRVETRE